MKILVYLFDADGEDRQVELSENILSSVNDKQLLWINILKRDEATLESVTKALRLEKVPMRGILRIYERPKIYKFSDFYHFFIISAETGFWMAVGGMGILAAITTSVALYRRWI